jgi:hypothetical protein
VGRPRWARKRSLRARFGPPSRELVVRGSRWPGVGELGVDPGEQLLVADQGAVEAAGFAQVAVGVPPVLVFGDPGGPFGVGSRVGAVPQELVPAGFPDRVLGQPEHGLVDVADVHQSACQGEDFAAGVEAGSQSVVRRTVWKMWK